MRLCGIVGMLMILFSMLNLFIFRLEPFLSWNFPIIWFGLIFFIDGLVYELRKKSLITNSPKRFIGMLLLSVVIWWTFEFFNFFIKNWSYHNIPEPKPFAFSVAFSTVLPAVMEMFDLISSFNIFKKIRIQFKASNRTVSLMFLLGAITLILLIVLPTYFFWTVWLSLFLLFEPINYLRKQESILLYIEKGKSRLVFSLLFAGLACGFLWEFFNYFSLAGWSYSIPWVSETFPKIFEMPLLGYLGYLPFSLELFAMYQFAMSFLVRK